METEAQRDHKLRLRTAYHEAGHAVACIDLDRKILYATIRPDEDSLGHVLTTQMAESFRPDLDSGLKSARKIEREILIFLAGPAAEWGRFGEGPVGEGTDIEMATALASYLYGGEVLDAYLAFLMARCRAMVAAPAFQVRVDSVARSLLAQERLSGFQVRKLCQEAIGEAIGRKWTGSPIDGSMSLSQWGLDGVPVDGPPGYP